jgi:hypothetical protein
LGRRLKELFRRNKSVVEWLCGSWRAAKEAVRRIVDARNGYSHGLQEHREVRGTAGYKVVSLMQAVMAMLLMEEAGFTGERIAEIAKNARSFEALRRQFE